MCVGGLLGLYTHTRTRARARRKVLGGIAHSCNCNLHSSRWCNLTVGPHSQYLEPELGLAVLLMDEHVHIAHAEGKPRRQTKRANQGQTDKAQGPRV
jgi:hypothetical protein